MSSLRGGEVEGTSSRGGEGEGNDPAGEGRLRVIILPGGEVAGKILLLRGGGGY
jgi:hypothetical protein